MISKFNSCDAMDGFADSASGHVMIAHRVQKCGKAQSESDVKNCEEFKSK